MLDIMEGPDQQNWRVFSRDTEAGRLLSRLYGVEGTGKPSISYPPPKKTPGNEAQHRPDWRAVNSKSGSTDPKSKSFDKGKAQSVAVPRVGRKNHNATQQSKLDRIPRRKTAKECRKEVETFDILQHAYRPPNQPFFSSDNEKERLSEIFTYKGGSALPNELTHAVGCVPSETKFKLKERERVRRAIARRRERLDGGTGSNPCSVPLQNNDAASKSVNEVLFDELVGEIQERRTFQDAMEEVGAGTSSRNATANEISTRVNQLKRLDPTRAAKVVAGLYNE